VGSNPTPAATKPVLSLAAESAEDDEGVLRRHLLDKPAAFDVDPRTLGSLALEFLGEGARARELSAVTTPARRNFYSRTTPGARDQQDRADVLDRTVTTVDYVAAGAR
jgi:hypothetical protein